jgi:acyl dehydratase
VLKLGHWESLAKHVTDADVVALSHVSQDTNPIHLDDEYASKSMYALVDSEIDFIGCIIIFLLLDSREE